MASGIKDYANVMLDPEGFIVSWNEGGERLKGYRQRRLSANISLGFILPKIYAKDCPPWN